MKTTILGIKITKRVEKSSKVQDLLTKFGCSIRTRLGLHEVSEDYCSEEGLIILELVGDEGEMLKLEEELKRIPGVEVRKMVFD
ncbi:MAG TPA: hypothetical protein DCX03_06885 [Bacteroidales bacterium]|jgi:hypothetical protein|nr:hypothetical protein [Bacteroidales bacterium]HQQ02963.1 hypothetical protein [Bacteroidales bacterium]